MKIKHFSNTDWHQDHPNGNLFFQYCLEGDPSSRDNFMLVLGRQDGDFYMPRHRHNFDQIRLPLRGDMNIGDGLKLKEGQVGYFVEGMPYGPQDDPGERLQLVLQFGGASGCGFMSMNQRLAARDELSKKGEFIGPNYRHPNGRVEWGLNVIWEHVFGERLKYPLPRYPKTVIADPERFNWLPARDAPMVRKKFLGAFSERAVWVEMVRIEPGFAWKSTHEQARRLLFVTAGSGVAGVEPIRENDAIQIEPNEPAVIRATTELTLFLMGLPPVVVPEDSKEQFETVDGTDDGTV